MPDLTPMSALAEVNPRHPAPVVDQPVSFVSMADVSQQGRLDQVRILPARPGLTPFIKGDVLVAKITPCLENGKGAHAENLPITQGQGSTEFHVLRARPAVHDRYIYHLTRTENFRLRAEAVMSGSAGQRRVPTSFFDLFHVSALGMAEQRRIAGVLDTIDEIVRASDRVIAKLKLARAGLTENVLADVDPGTRMRLASVADVAGGLALSADRAVTDPVELPYLRVANVQDGFIDTTIMKTVEVDSSQVYRYELRSGDVLMNEGGDFDKLGRGAVWDGQISPCLHQNHVFRVRCDTTRLLPEFLSLFCQSAEGRSYFLNNSKQTTNLASINKRQIGAFPILAPCLAAQRRAVGAVRAVHDFIEAEAARSQKLRETRAGLADDLLSGRVRVPA